MAEAKEAELNAKALQLESTIHWLQQENKLLKARGMAPAAGGMPKAGSSNGSTDPSGGNVRQVAALQAEIAVLQVEIRKLRRADQKWQAMVYRLRQEGREAVGRLAASGSAAGGRGAAALNGASFMDLWDDMRERASLEYDLDLLRNKCAVSCVRRMFCRSHQTVPSAACCSPSTSH